MGVPARLSNEAVAAKEKTDSLRTLPRSVAHQSPVRLPPGVTREVFDKAIDELRKVLGEKGVELNDRLSRWLMHGIWNTVSNFSPEMGQLQRTFTFLTGIPTMRTTTSSTKKK